MPKTPPLPLKGGCQCGAIRYEICAEPLSLYACHCTECQKQTGAAFALSMMVPREALVVTSGTPKVWVRRHDSGRKIDALFCPECGTRLWHDPHVNDKVSILKPGTLDDARWLEPVGHIWTDSAQAWVAIPPDTLLYPRQQPDNAAMIEAFKRQRE